MSNSEFIGAERVNDFSLHLLATKAMLNLFAAARHKNYAKSCRLYLQSVQELETNHTEVFKEFQEDNHTVRRTSKKWTGNLDKFIDRIDSNEIFEG